MSTLALLKARISSDLEGAGTDAQIADEINSAISFYNRQRFYFNEKRTETFPTVASQREYTTTNTIVTIDQVQATVSGDVRRLYYDNPLDMEIRHDTNTMTGAPTRWTRYANTFSLYPLPDGVYTIRVLGQLKIAGPATDDEADNPWMTEAFELLRCRAKLNLFAHALEYPEKVPALIQLEAMELDALNRETSRRIGTGQIVSTCF